MKLQFSQEQKEMLQQLASTAATPEIKERVSMDLAVSLSELLLKSNPTDSFVRSIYDVRNATDRGYLRFPIAPNQPVAWALAKIGTIPRNFLEGDEMEIPTEPYGTRVSFSLDYLSDANYDMVGYAAGEIQTAITRIEEEVGWRLLRWTANNGGAGPAAAGTAPGSITYATQKIEVATANVGAGYFSKQLFSAGKKYFEKRGWKPRAIYGPADMMSDTRNWALTQIDDVTARQIFVDGELPSIWGMPLNVVPQMEVYESVGDRKSDTPTRIDRLFDADDTLTGGSAAWSDTQKTRYAAGTFQVAYMIGDDQLGIMGVREPLRVVADTTLIPEWQMGWVARERAGFGISDTRKIVMLMVDRTSTES